MRRLRLYKKKSVKSTNDYAIKLIKKENLKPSLIISEIQTKGRGTMGKKWISKKGNLFISILFDYNPKIINFKQIAILNSYLLKKILKKFCNEKIKIKWPNDLLIRGKKICGILQETVNYDKKNFLIIGIGINTNITPYIKNNNATSIKENMNKKINNNEVLKYLKKVYENFINEIHKTSFTNIKKKLIIK